MSPLNDMQSSNDNLSNSSSNDNLSNPLPNDTLSNPLPNDNLSNPLPNDNLSNSSINDKQSPQETQSPHDKQSLTTTQPTPCSACETYKTDLTNLQGRVDVMDSELRKLRTLAREAQAQAREEDERNVLERRQLRQLLITYMTSVRGGAALRALMEKLVCLEAP